MKTKRFHSGNWSKDVEAFEKAMIEKIAEQFKEKTGLVAEGVQHCLPVNRWGQIHTIDRTYSVKTTAFGKIIQLTEEK